MSFFYKPYIDIKKQWSLQNHSEAQATNKFIPFLSATAVCQPEGNSIRDARKGISYLSAKTDCRLQGHNIRYIRKKVNKNRRKNLCKKRAFCCTSLSGVMTVEAAVILPLFLMAVLSLLNLIHMVGTGQSVFMAMARTAHCVSVYGYKEDFDENRIFAELIYELGSSDIDFDAIYLGMAGLNYQHTSYHKESGEITLSVKYGLKPLFSLFGTGTLNMQTTIHSRAFIGGKMLTDVGDSTQTEGETVYVAENGVVYHKDRECFYIDVSLNAASVSSVEGMRNSQGAKYYPCELCMSEGNAGGIVYVTNTGNRYHTSVNCSGLKRTVYEMEVTGECVLPACSRCGH